MVRKLIFNAIPPYLTFANTAIIATAVTRNAASAMANSYLCHFFFFTIKNQSNPPVSKSMIPIEIILTGI